MNVLNRLLSLLLGLLLLALGLAAIAWIIVTKIGAHDFPGGLFGTYRQVLSVVTAGGSLGLSRGTGLGICIALVIIGILLLFFELKPSPPQRLDMGERDHLRWRIDRRSFEQALGWLLQSRTAARGISVRLHRGWRLNVSAEADAQTKQEMESELKALLQRLGSDGVAQVRLKIRRSRGVA